MNQRKKRTLELTSMLNLPIIYCLLRFGLVFTTRWRFFELSLIVFLGVAMLLTYAFIDKWFAGQFLQRNLLFLGLNIFCVFLIQHLTKNPTYASAATGYINQLLVLFLLWGFYLYMQRLNITQQRRLIGVYLLAITVSTVYTFHVASVGDDLIIRNTAFSQYDTSFQFAYGGFDFIYGLVVIYSALLIVLSQGGNRIRPLARVELILLLLLIASTVIISKYSTAFVLILVFTILIVPKKTGFKVFWAILLIVFVFWAPQFLTRFIESIPFMPEITSSRINDLILSVSGRGSSAYITEEGQRLDRVFWSLKAFAENPLLGLFGGNGTRTLGSHTEWIDQLARYGIVTAIFNMSFWLTTYKRMKITAKQSSITHKCLVSTFIMYFILGFLNPISMVVTSAPLFILCPFVESLLTSEKAADGTPTKH